MITGIVLAADAARQLGTAKAEALFGGQRLVDRAVATLHTGGCDQVIAVVERSDVQVEAARVIADSDPNPGVGSSLRAGLSAVPVDTEAVVITRVDLPGVLASEVKAALGWYRNGASLLITRRAGRRSYPMLVSRRWLRQFALSLQADQSARAFFATNYEDIDFLDYAEPMADIETPEDLAAAERRYC